MAAIAAATVDSSIWGGAILNSRLIGGPSTVYLQSNHAFSIPANGHDGGQAAIWGGVGGMIQNGFNDYGLIQNGVWLESDGTTDLWYEYIQVMPTNLSQVTGPPFHFTFPGGLHVGDPMSFSCASVDANGHPSVNGGHAYFSFFNGRTNEHTQGTFLTAAGAPWGQFQGYSAEWIVERPPAANGALPYFDNYGTVSFVSEVAFDQTGTFHTPNTDNFLVGRLFDSGRTLMESVGYTTAGGVPLNMTWLVGF